MPASKRVYAVGIMTDDQKEFVNIKKCASKINAERTANVWWMEHSFRHKSLCIIVWDCDDDPFWSDPFQSIFYFRCRPGTWIEQFTHHLSPPEETD